MKKILKKIVFTAVFLIAGILIIGLVLAYLPSKSIVKNNGVTPEEAAVKRSNFKGPHEHFATSDGKTLFLRRWDPDTINLRKKDIAVLLFHGVTAHSGAYDMAGNPISSAGYTTFGLDLRGHGLSDGNRGDSPNKERYIADLAESVKYLKSLGYKRIVILGHSLGVASAICTANAVPEDISGLILLSGAYEGKKSTSTPTSLFKKIRIVASSVFRPSFQVIEAYSETMTGLKDPLFNFRYTLRFLTMIDVKQLKLPANMNIPVLVGVGDKDELFDVDKVKEFYDLIPGNKKEFLVMKNATHANIPVESWDEIVKWLDKNF